MDFIAQMRKDLIRDEGMVLKPYRCTAGKLTIGVGRNLEANGVSEAEALIMLDNDILNSMKELNERLAFFAELPDHVKRALINMHFNLGWGGLSKFRNMLADISARDFHSAANEARNSLWAKQVGARADRVVALMRGEVQ